MSHSARIRMPWPSSAQFTAISPSLVLRLPRTLTVSVRPCAAGRQPPHAVGLVALADADAVVACQVLRRCGVPCARQVGGRGAQQAPVGRHAAGDHARVGRLAEADAHVKASSVSGGGLTDSCSCTCTSGCGARSARSAAPTWLRPKPSVAFTRSSPLGAGLAAPTSCSMSSISARMRRACSRYHLALGRQAHAPGGAVAPAARPARLHLRQPLADGGRGHAQLARRGARGCRTLPAG
jgi:hypothetical protein